MYRQQYAFVLGSFAYAEHYLNQIYCLLSGLGGLLWFFRPKNSAFLVLFPTGQLLYSKLYPSNFFEHLPPVTLSIGTLDWAIALIYSRPLPLSISL